MAMVLDGATVRELEIKVYEDRGGRLAFGASTPAGVVALEALFPDGEWTDDEDGRPLLRTSLEIAGLAFWTSDEDTPESCDAGMEG